MLGFYMYMYMYICMYDGINTVLGVIIQCMDQTRHCASQQLTMTAIHAECSVVVFLKDCLSFCLIVMHVHIHVHVHVHVFCMNTVCARVHMHCALYMDWCINTLVHVHVCVHELYYVYMYNVYTGVYVYMYVCTHVLSHDGGCNELCVAVHLRSYNQSWRHSRQLLCLPSKMALWKIR